MAMLLDWFDNLQEEILFPTIEEAPEYYQAEEVEELNIACLDCYDLGKECGECQGERLAHAW